MADPQSIINSAMNKLRSLQAGGKTGELIGSPQFTSGTPIYETRKEAVEEKEISEASGDDRVAAEEANAIVENAVESSIEALLSRLI